MDNLDLDELKGLFLEECAENLDVLESGLLALSEQSVDKETLDAIFRAAHSIKGGGATFGFAVLSELTHHVEAYLECLRSSTVQLTDAALQTMLAAVDVIRDMLRSADGAVHAAHPEKSAMVAKLNSLVSGNTGRIEQSVTEPPLESVIGTWRIHFAPNADMATRGNDPYLILRELRSLGEVVVKASMERLPTWESYVPKTSYLCWTIELKTTASRALISELFEWVEFDCVLSIDPVDPDPRPIAPEFTAPVLIAKTDNPIKAGADGASMRIATDKIDRILDLVGELVITQSMLSRSGRTEGNVDSALLLKSLDLLERNTRELQESVMRVRMLPISFAFGRLPRMIRDLSKQLNKKVELTVIGETTEVDKTVLDHLLDPLVHLVRNAIDHGLEDPKTRAAAGKSEAGQLRLEAYHQSGSIVIKIEDDGQGINTQRVLQIARDKGLVDPSAELLESDIHQLIFAPGFSTAEQVSEISGRGVGMDVVRRNIVELGGKVNITSARGAGSLVTIKLPLTLAILEGQLIQVATQTFVVPIVNIVETVEIRHASISNVPGTGPVAGFRDRYIPLIYLEEQLLDEPLTTLGTDALVLVIEVHGVQAGLVIDAVLGQQQVVIKSLEENYRKVRGISGATIMSDGSVALIIDTAAFVQADDSRIVA